MRDRSRSDQQKSVPHALKRGVRHAFYAFGGDEALQTVQSGGWPQVPYSAELLWVVLPAASAPGMGRRRAVSFPAGAPLLCPRFW